MRLRSNDLTNLLLVLCGAILALVLSACGDSDDPGSTEAQGDTTTTTAATTTTVSAVRSVEAVVDSLYVAFETVDPVTASALFTEDGVWVDKFGGEWVGTAGVTDYVERVGPGISRCVRVGAAEPHDDGSYVFAIAFTYNGTDYEAVAAVTIKDDLISRHGWMAEP